MKKFALAAIAVALIGLASAPPAAAQYRPPAGSFSTSFRDGFARGLGREAAARVVGGFYGSRVAGLGFGRPTFYDPVPVRAGFYFGRAEALRQYEIRRQFEIQRALELRRLRSFGGFYGSQSFYLPPAASFYAAPPQPFIIEQSQVGYAASACGALGLGAGYGYGALGVTSGCGVGAFRSALPLRGYYR